MKPKTSGAVTRRTSMAPEMQTPPTLFESLHSEFAFTLDPCCQVGDPTAEKILADGGRIFVPGPPVGVLPPLNQSRILVDGLAHDWAGEVVYMNPPYDRTLALWVAKAASEVKKGRAKKVVALLPANTGSPWWQQYVVRGFHVHFGAERKSNAFEQVRFLPSRLQFHWKGEPMKFKARFASVVVVWSR